MTGAGRRPGGDGLIPRVLRSREEGSPDLDDDHGMSRRHLLAAASLGALAALALWASVGRAPRALAHAPSHQPAARSLRIGPISGVLVLPAHARALAIVIHGGEIAANRNRAALSTRVAARVYFKRLAPSGIGVLSVDYRWGAYGGLELSDIEAALARVAREPATAHLPIILIGASHGGYLAALAATRPVAAQANLRAVVDLYGFSDLAATVSDPSSRYDPQARLTLRALGPPANNQTAYAARSPLALAALLRAPLFQLVGGSDRSTRPEVLALSRALRARGRASELHVIPGRAHGFAFGSSSSAIVWREVVAFLRRLGLAR